MPNLEKEGKKCLNITIALRIQCSPRTAATVSSQLLSACGEGAGSKLNIAEVRIHVKLRFLELREQGAKKTRISNNWNGCVLWVESRLLCNFRISNRRKLVIHRCTPVQVFPEFEMLLPSLPCQIFAKIVLHNSRPLIPPLRLAHPLKAHIIPAKVRVVILRNESVKLERLVILENAPKRALVVIQKYECVLGSNTTPAQSTDAKS